MKRLLLLLAVFFSAVFQSCCYSPFSSADSLPRTTLEYSVAIPAMDLDSIVITLRIPAWYCSDSVRLLAPPVYADNPQLVQSGANFFPLSFVDKRGDQINYRSGYQSVGIFNTQYVSFPADRCPATITYYIKFQYARHDFMPLPGIHALNGYLQGNCMFVTPAAHRSTVDIWRDTLFNFKVRYNLGSTVRLFGDPDSVVFETPYQLLFSKSAVFAHSVVGSQVLYSGQMSGQKIRFVNMSPDTVFPQDLVDKTVRDFTVIVHDITSKFGTLYDFPYTIITGINNYIGFEGTYAFCLRNFLRWQDTADVAMTMAHEYMHAWIGVLAGEYEDPWWKEGTTTYLGVLIPKRNNLCSYQYIRNGLVIDHSGVPYVDELVLSDPQVRSLLYHGPSYGTLVYQKGAQVGMLLDRRIRQVSNNTTSLVDILAELARIYKGKAFRRQEYLSLIHDRSGASVQDIFDRYVDSPGAVPVPVLKENFDALAIMGAFGAIDTSHQENTTEPGFFDNKVNIYF